jgi:hypothetical protein
VQHRRPGDHPDHPRERARRAGGVTRQRDPVPDNHPPAAQLAGPHGGDDAFSHQAPVPTPVHGSHETLDRVLVRGPSPGTRARTPPGPHPHVVFVQATVSSTHGQGSCSSIASHRPVKEGNVLPTVVAFCTWMPGTASPITAAAITSR